MKSGIQKIRILKKIYKTKGMFFMFKKVIYKLFFCIFSCFFVVSFLFALQEKENKSNVDKPLAIINSEIILMSDFNNDFLEFFEQYKKIHTSQISDKDIINLKDLLLNQKIVDSLLNQEAKKRKIKVTKNELKNAVNEIKKAFKNESLFYKSLDEEKIKFSDFEKDLYKHIVVMKLLKEITNKNVVVPSENDIKMFYDNVLKKINSTSFVDKDKTLTKYDLLVESFAKTIKREYDEQVKVSQIFISCPKNVSQNELKNILKKIEIIKNKLKTQDFYDVLMKYSEDVESKNNKGIIGRFSKNSADPDLSKIIFSLKVGEYTKEPIKTEYGYHFLKIEEKISKKTLIFNDVKNNISELLHIINTEKAHDDFMKKIASESKIKINKNW
jgi:parvulin-like peptidyl-prolyl isomerase